MRCKVGLLYFLSSEGYLCLHKCIKTQKTTKITRHVTLSFECCSIWSFIKRFVFLLLNSNINSVSKMYLHFINDCKGRCQILIWNNKKIKIVQHKLKSDVVIKLTKFKFQPRLRARELEILFFRARAFYSFFQTPSGIFNQCNCNTLALIS